MFVFHLMCFEKLSTSLHSCAPINENIWNTRLSWKLVDSEERGTVLAHWYCLISQRKGTRCMQLQGEWEWFIWNSFYVVMLFGCLLIIWHIVFAILEVKNCLICFALAKRATWGALPVSECWAGTQAFVLSRALLPRHSSFCERLELNI